jgi:hypothetical protein
MGAFRDGRHNPKRKPRRSPHLPTAASRLLREQRDVIAWWQLREAELSADRIARIVDAGLLRPLPGRVFTTTAGRVERPARRWAAVLSAGPRARLASHTVLELLDIAEPPGDDHVHVVVPGSAGRPTPGVVLHRTTKLADHERVRHDGYPATTVSRALLDAAADSTADTLAGYLDRAVMLGRYDAADIQRALGERRAIPGRGTFEAATATLDESTGRFLSEFERKVHQLIRTSTRIPLPEVNVLAEGYRPDLRFPGTAALLECDGRDYHRSMAQIVADGEREAILHALGFVILRLRWSQLAYEPERTLQRIEQHALANAHPPVPDLARLAELKAVDKSSA